MIHPSKTLVISHNQQAAKQWIVTHIQRRKLLGETSLSISDYVIVNTPEQLLGLRNPKGYFVGNYLERPDIADIVVMLLRNTDTTASDGLQRVWRELHEIT